MRVMDTALEALPDDLATLRAMVLSARAETARLLAINARLEHIVQQLRRLQFGARSERLDADQLDLALEDLEQAEAEIRAEQEKHDPALKTARAQTRRNGRPALPPHLPRVEVVVAPQSTACPCCQGPMHVIGEDSSSRLDVVPAQYRVLVTRRPKYACRACTDGVVQAPAPARLIAGGLPTEALVAQVLSRKYADHLPLYRQAQMLARQGIAIERATLAHWAGTAAAELRPVYDWLKRDLLGSGKLFVDETPAPVLDPGRGRTKSGYFWTLARDDRPWGGRDPPAVVYSYAPGRGAEHAAKLLAEYSGVLQTDGYSGYKSLADPRRSPAPVTLAHCWAHLRRRFFELTKGGAAPIATEALRRIAELYRIEEEIRGRSAAERQAVRAARTRPLVDALQLWLKARLAEVSGRAPIADAIRYGLNHWAGLTRFLEDGRIEIDSNTVERTIRPIALNRKNALFAGSDEGGVHWAVLATLIETCKLHAVDPEAYLADVLTRLVNLWPNSRLAELAPWNWATSQAQ